MTLLTKSGGSPVGTPSGVVVPLPSVVVNAALPTVRESGPAEFRASLE